MLVVALTDVGCASRSTTPEPAASQPVSPVSVAIASENADRPAASPNYFQVFFEFNPIENEELNRIAVFSRNSVPAHPMVVFSQDPGLSHPAMGDKRGSIRRSAIRIQCSLKKAKS
jgi:hypothetical protein